MGKLHLSRSNDCEEYGSVNRKKVCQARAHVLKKLNGDDEDIFIYSDARSTHDVIASSEGKSVTWWAVVMRFFRYVSSSIRKESSLRVHM